MLLPNTNDNENNNKGVEGNLGDGYIYGFDDDNGFMVYTYPEPIILYP